MATLRQRRGGDDGVTLVMVALMFTGLLTVVALVMDLGYVRGSARADQSIADLAALAGGEMLENERYVEACQDMIEYLNLNATGMPAIEAVPFCSSMNATSCTTPGGVAQVAPTATSGKYTVTIEYPVPDEAGDYPAMGAGIEDGPACDRMRVTVTSTDPAFFGGVVGASEYQATRTATIRAGPGDVLKAPALWLLEPHGCNSLVTGGSNTAIIVGNLNHDPPVEGLISVDSDGTTCNSGYTIDVSQGRVHALPIWLPDNSDDLLGQIRSFAMPRMATNCVAPACNPADTAGDRSSTANPPRLAPVPLSVKDRATRAPVDHRWNCKEVYPNYLTIAIAGCEEADARSAYIDQLRSAYGTGAPGGWNVYPGAGQTCALDPGDASTETHVVLSPGNWYINCNTLRIPDGTSMTIEGGNVVIKGANNGGVATTGGGILRINTANTLNTSGLPLGCLAEQLVSMCSDSSPRAAWVYIQRGDLDIKTEFVAKHTMIHLADGSIKITGGGFLDWTAPKEGPFAGLSTWAEKGGAHSVSGGGVVTMAGTFFMPYADALNISGGGAWDVDHAQFIVRRLRATGGAYLEMSPDPVDAVTLPPREGFLIR